jgi:nucleoid DNA-binding protein
MNIKELAATLAVAHPDVSTKTIEALLTAAFSSVKEELSASSEEQVKCLPLGVFKIITKPAKGTADKPAAADASPTRRFMLRLAKDKGDKPAKAAPKGAEHEAKVAARKAARKAAPKSK